MNTDFLVVNCVTVDEREITVGATNSTRWQWDIDDGQSGADARTLVWVVLEDNGAGCVTSETAGLFCDRTDPLRPLAVSGIESLFEIAWAIKERGLAEPQARTQYFGMAIKVA